jgi:hypothetical protein
MFKGVSWFRNWTRGKVERLEQDANRGRQLQLEKDCQPFVEDFKERLATYLAHVPFTQWPAWCKSAYGYSAEHFPVPARLYMEQHMICNQPENIPPMYQRKG